MSPIGIARATLAAAAAAVSSTAPAPESSASPAVNASGTAFPELAHFFGNNTQWANHMAQDDPDFFPSTNKSQHPGIVWLGCSDSRVPESVITQQHPGSIFTHRNIANQFHDDDWSAHAVMEYATAHLNVSHIVVVGHTNCGGAAAAFAAPNPDAAESTPASKCDKSKKKHGHKHGHDDEDSGIEDSEEEDSEEESEDDSKSEEGGEGTCSCFTPDQVKPGTEPGLENFLAPLIKLRHTLPANATVHDLIVANVKHSVHTLTQSNAVQNMWAQNKRVCVHGWLYNIGTGLLEDLGFSRCEAPRERREYQRAFVNAGAVRHEEKRKAKVEDC